MYQGAQMNYAPVTDEHQKLDYIIQKMNNLDNLSSTLQQTNFAMQSVCETVETLANRQSDIDDRLTRLEMRTVDIEARSRRNNLIFYNLLERVDESEEQCENLLIDFLENRLGLNDARNIAFQRTHRLGRAPRRGTVGDRPRPVITCFRDYKIKQLVLKRANRLAGTNLSIQEDFPPEIRKARTDLWPAFQRAKATEQYAKIVYPAKLVVGGRVVKDMFPQWGRWMVGSHGDTATAPAADTRDDRRPRAGSSMNIPMTDLLNANQFVPRSQGGRNWNNHGAETTQPQRSGHMPPTTAQPFLANPTGQGHQSHMQSMSPHSYEPPLQSYRPAPQYPPTSVTWSLPPPWQTPPAYQTAVTQPPAQPLVTSSVAVSVPATSWANSTVMWSAPPQPPPPQPLPPPPLQLSQRPPRPPPRPPQPPPRNRHRETDTANAVL